MKNPFKRKKATTGFEQPTPTLTPTPTQPRKQMSEAAFLKATENIPEVLMGSPTVESSAGSLSRRVREMKAPGQPTSKGTEDYANPDQPIPSATAMQDPERNITTNRTDVVMGENPADKKPRIWKSGSSQTEDK